MNTIRRTGIIVLTLVACVGCDQSTKYAAKQFLQGQDTISMLGDCLRLGYAENLGGFLGLGSALPEHWRTRVFLLFATLSLLALLAYAVLGRNMDRLRRMSITLVVGGGLGNVIDRIVNNGSVVDFLNVGVGSLRTGVFNVADMAIMSGAVMLLLSLKTARVRGDS